MDQQWVQLVADIIDDGVAGDFNSAGFRLNLNLADMTAVGEVGFFGIIGGDLVEPRLNPIG